MRQRAAMPRGGEPGAESSGRRPGARASTRPRNGVERVPIVEDGVIAGNLFDKYGTRNLVASRLVRGFLRSFDELVARSGAHDIHEVGCGEGHLAQRLARSNGVVRASDFSRQVIGLARRRAERIGLPIAFDARCIYDLQRPRDAAELVVCCEVLEHLDDPDRALSVLAGLARPWLLVSVPREPLWRVLNLSRGRYLSGWGNTPGHKQHWSTGRFRELVAQHLEVDAVRTPIPWTMILARSRSSHRT